MMNGETKTPETGSSPLARGTPPKAPLVVSTNRFIPARAGNTSSAPLSTRSRAVHPRSRGEHLVGRTRALLATGSSPLARGTPSPPGPRGRVRRFIPARAGNTNSLPATHRARPVHPRSRGEHQLRPAQHPVPCGSSPLARGTLMRVRMLEGHDRFIPARAGNTHTMIERAARDGGSSPLARGTPSRDHRSSLWMPVHPRSRGEHPPRTAYFIVVSGSSPLARGTHVRTGERRRRGRFIPARAGNTRAASRT